jgi:hypothetical protein
LTKTITNRGILLVVLLITLSGYGQQKCYTFKAVAPAYVLLSDSAIHITHDTTLTICESYILLTKQNGYNFYNKLIAASEKHVFLKELYKMALASPPTDTALQKKNLLKAEDIYKPFEGRPIRKVKIKVLKPFGPTINDTTRPTITYVEKALNPTHIKTRDYVIRKKLLFEKNDTIDPMILVENARILTNLSFLQDASIVVTPSTGDSVDVLVLVKDKFPWLAVPNIVSSSKFDLYLKQANIMGLGQSVGMGLTLDTKSTPQFYMSSIDYSINNAFQLIDADLSYDVGNNSQNIQLALTRQLIPTKVNMGGGLTIANNAENLLTDPTYRDKSLYYFNYMFYEAWISYVVPLKKLFPNLKEKNVYLIPGISFSKTNYSKRPTVTLDTNSQFFNYDYLLGNLVVSKQDYYRTNYLLNFGKAEYIPYGFQASITGGYSWTEFMQKPYAGAGLSITTHIDHIGFVFGNIEVGSHFTNGWEQGAFKFDMVHLSDLFVKKKNRFRLMTELSITSSINRFSDDLLYLGEEYGFVGLSSETFYGQQRTFLETTLLNYTHFYLFGFRVALLGFANIGTIGPQHIKFTNRQLLTNFGVGVYVRNDFLVFSSIEFRVAYFPVTPSGISHLGISFSSNNLLDRLNFLYTKPQQVLYE